MNVQCPKCSVRGQSGERWHATGRRNTNRYGRRRAELVCDVCAYVFSSGLPAAMEAAEAVSAEEVRPVIDEVATEKAVQAGMDTVVFAQPSMQPVGALVKDWKLKQAGDE